MAKISTSTGRPRIVSTYSLAARRTRVPPYSSDSPTTNPASDPAVTTMTPISRVTPRPRRSWGNAKDMSCVMSADDRVAPFDAAEDERDPVPGDQVHHRGERPGLDRPERVDVQPLCRVGQLGNGEGRSQGRVLEERDERVAQGRENDPEGHRKRDQPDALPRHEANGFGGL